MGLQRNMLMQLRMHQSHSHRWMQSARLTQIQSLRCMVRFVTTCWSCLAHRAIMMFSQGVLRWKTQVTVMSSLCMKLHHVQMMMTSPWQRIAHYMPTDPSLSW